MLPKSDHFNEVSLSVSQITPHVFLLASHRMSRCKLEALHPLHSSSPQAHGSSEHKHVSGQGKYLERGITDTESCEVYVELQVWRGHIIVRQFSEVKDSLSKYLSFCPLFFVPLRAPSAPPHHIPFPSFHTSKDSIAHYVV